MISKPQAGEYAAFYAGYVSAVPDGDILEILTRLKDTTHQFCTTLPAEKENYAYAPGKWTIKQLLSHMVDAERVFAFRFLCFSRRDETALPGFDENVYVENADLNNRTLKDLANEFKDLRHANLYMFNSITQAQSTFVGTANGNPVSVRALLYITAGHEIHHLGIIKERYL